MTGRPSQRVASQQKICMPFGNGDHHAGSGEEAGAEPGQAGREHVVDPKAERQEAHRDQRQHQRQIAKHRPAREAATMDETMPVAGRKMM